MRTVSENQLQKVKEMVSKEGGIQSQFISLPEDYKDRVETTNRQSKKMLERIIKTSMARV